MKFVFCSTPLKLAASILQFRCCIGRIHLAHRSLTSLGFGVGTDRRCTCFRPGFLTIFATFFSQTMKAILRKKTYGAFDRHGTIIRAS